MKSFNMSPDSLEQAVVQRKKEGRLTPKVIAAPDLFGQPVKIQRIAEKYGLLPGKASGVLWGRRGSVYGQ